MLEFFWKKPTKHWSLYRVSEQGISSQPWRSKADTRFQQYALLLALKSFDLSFPSTDNYFSKRVFSYYLFIICFRALLLVLPVHLKSFILFIFIYELLFYLTLFLVLFSFIYLFYLIYYIIFVFIYIRDGYITFFCMRNVDIVLCTEIMLLALVSLFFSLISACFQSLACTSRRRWMTLAKTVAKMGEYFELMLANNGLALSNIPQCDMIASIHIGHATDQ